MNRLFSLVRKELLQLRNDPAGLRIILVPVFIQLFVLGYAITTEVRNITFTVCDRSVTPQSRSLIQSLQTNPLFVFRGIAASERDVRATIDQGKTSLGLVIPPDFARDLERGTSPHISVIVDGQDANSANVASGYMSAIVSRWGRDHLARQLKKSGRDIDQIIPITVRPVILFNPLLKSTWFMVPGLAVILITTITALLTSFSIVREKEGGTLEQLLVTPVKPAHIIAGKSIPFFIIGLFELGAVLLIARLWFGVPFRGSYPTLAVFAVVYMFSTLGIGLLTSSISRTPHQALFTIWFILLFFILLSGFFIPLENMPHWVQQVTRISPVRYFITVIREIFLKGSGFKELWRELVAMTIIGVSVYTTAVVSFKRRVG